MAALPSTFLAMGVTPCIPSEFLTSTCPATQIPHPTHARFASARSADEAQRPGFGCIWMRLHMNDESLSRVTSFVQSLANVSPLTVNSGPSTKIS
jgi:hypothetical protein